MLLKDLVGFLQFFVVFVALPTEDNFALFEFVAVIDKHQVFQIFKIESSHIVDFLLIFVPQVIEEGIHGLSKLGMTHDFQILFIIVFFRDRQSDQLGFLDF